MRVHTCVMRCTDQDFTQYLCAYVLKHESALRLRDNINTDNLKNAEKFLSTQLHSTQDCIFSLVMTFDL